MTEIIVQVTPPPAVQVEVSTVALVGPRGLQGPPGVDGTVIEVGTTPPSNTSHLWLDTN